MTLDHTHPVIANAYVGTYAAAAGTATAWGLHLGDLGVMVSSLAAVCGAVIQVLNYLDTRRKRARGEETDTHGKAD